MEKYLSYLSDQKDNSNTNWESEIIEIESPEISPIQKKQLRDFESRESFVIQDRTQTPVFCSLDSKMMPIP